MMRPDNARELVKTFDAVEELFLELLQNGDWQKLDDLREQIPAELAETRYRLSGSQIDDSLPDRDNAIQGTYRRVLAREIVDSLVGRKLCEFRQENGVDAVRLAATDAAGSGVPPTPDAVEGTTPKPEIKAASATPKDDSPKAPPTKPTKKKPAGTAKIAAAKKQPAAKSSNRDRPRKKAVVSLPTSIEDEMKKYFGEL